MEEVIFFERKKIRKNITVSSERLIMEWKFLTNDIRTTVLVKSIDSFHVVDMLKTGILLIIFSVFSFIAWLVILEKQGWNELAIIISFFLFVISLIVGVLYLTSQRFTLVVSAKSGKIKFQPTIFGGTEEIIGALTKAVLYKPEATSSTPN
ncbi:MAG: hypothetical protein LBU89_04320 [Fibromonadaceae bacterium]|jgi:hypothetical protein|nr:hypothetical protein [Fibromonadaceae bacterium]